MYHMKVGKGKDQKAYKVNDSEMNNLLAMKKAYPDEFVKVQGDMILPRDIQGFDKVVDYQQDDFEERKKYLYELNRRRNIPEWVALEQECYDTLKQIQRYSKGTDKSIISGGIEHLRYLADEMRKIAIKHNLPVKI